MTDRRLTLLLLALLALAGVGLVVLANVGDAMAIAATGGVQAALDRAGQGGNIPLRNKLFSVVVRLREPWGLVQWVGIAVAAAAVAAWVVVRRGPR